MIYDRIAFTREEHSNSVYDIEDVEEISANSASHFLVIARNLLHMNVQRKKTNTDQRKYRGNNTRFPARGSVLTITEPPDSIVPTPREDHANICGDDEGEL